MSPHIVIIGPAYPLRGGLSSFNERLAREFIANDYETEIYTFSLQYPAFLFPGTTQYSSEPAPADLLIHEKINSISPLNWLWVGYQLCKKKTRYPRCPLLASLYGTLSGYHFTLGKEKSSHQNHLHC